MAGYLNTTLLIPNFHYHSIWKDPRFVCFSIFQFCFLFWFWTRKSRDTGIVFHQYYFWKQRLYIYNIIVILVCLLILNWSLLFTKWRLIGQEWLRLRLVCAVPLILDFIFFILRPSFPFFNQFYNVELDDFVIPMSSASDLSHLFPLVFFPTNVEINTSSSFRMQTWILF